MGFTASVRCDLGEGDRNGLEFVWKKDSPILFNELIVSWNGLRPVQGRWTFFVRLKQANRWSEWLKYAEWGADGQKTFKESDSVAESYQDAVTPKTGLCQAFSVKIRAEEGADLKQLDSLYACLSDLSRFSIVSPRYLSPVFLKGMFRRSQMILEHPRRKDLCSPTSTSTAVNYLLGNPWIDPVAFAKKSHDAGFDIFGNWILNTAEGYQRLEGSYRVFVKRLDDFQSLHEQLVRGAPIVVSVKGTIPGAPQPYAYGHLICITGFEPNESSERSKVHCVDPAFPNDESTLATYNLTDFLSAWGTRRNLAYIFEKKTYTAPA